MYNTPVVSTKLVKNQSKVVELSSLRSYRTANMKQNSTNRMGLVICAFIFVSAGKKLIRKYEITVTS